jgi:hypothetical protein
MIIPLHEADRWRIEKYRNIPANEISFTPKGMMIRVKRSASPFVYPLKEAIKLKGFQVKGKFLGLPKFAEPQRQGEKGADDYAFRIGFVIPGERQLSGLKKLFAPPWIKGLYALAPPGAGIDHIEFFNVTQNPQQVGQERIHPLSNLLHENFITRASRDGAFEIQYTFREPLNASAIWVNVDGDDTGSAYEVNLSYLEIYAL